MRNYKLANIGRGLSDPTILTMAGRETECSCNNAYNDGAGQQHAYITVRDLRITVSGEKYESTTHRHASNTTTYRYSTIYSEIYRTRHIAAILHDMVN